MSLLPSSDDVSAEQDGEIRVLGVEEEETTAVFEALSSDTARRIVSAIYEEPAPASALADRLDLSLQNVSYHLDNLEDAGVVQVAGTQYSEKGAEMQVYAPADDPIVVFVGTEDRRSGLVDRLKQLVGATGLLLLASLAVFAQGLGRPAAGGDGGGSLPLLSIPGVEFLLGGLFVLAVFVIWWAWVR